MTIGKNRFVNPHTGIAGVAVKQGKKQQPKNVEEKNRIKQICLNCTRKTCKGCGKKKLSEQGKKGEKNGK